MPFSLTICLTNSLKCITILIISSHPQIYTKIIIQLCLNIRSGSRLIEIQMLFISLLPIWNASFLEFFINIMIIVK